MTKRIEVPFTPEQVTELNNFQLHMHPFTCPNRGDHKHDPSGDGILVATVRGWICPYCDYVQKWAHSFMAESAKNEG